VCCQVEVSATSWSLVQRGPTDCDASLCVIQKPQKWGGHDSRWVAAPQEKKIHLLDVANTAAAFHTLWLPVTLITVRSSFWLPSAFSDHSDECLLNNLPTVDHTFCTQSPLVYKYLIHFSPSTYSFIHGDISKFVSDCCDFWATKECFLLLADKFF